MRVYQQYGHSTGFAYFEMKGPSERCVADDYYSFKYTSFLLHYSTHQNP